MIAEPFVYNFSRTKISRGRRMRLDEFTFRYNSRTAIGVDDTGRAGLILAGTAGKCLTYRRISDV
jgi:hypothetical protein